MSLSPTCILHCNESVSLDADIFGDDREFLNHSLVDANEEEEDYILSMFNSEDDHQKQGGSELLEKYLKLPDLVTARQEAIKWMFKAHTLCRFSPETAYMSVNYLDRFLLSHSNSMKQGKGWQWQLLSVACMILAAKMEEISVPNLLDLQLIESSRFLFKPKTVRRMELLVMSSLKWRLRTITPFNFVHYFISKIPCFSPHGNGFTSVFSLTSDLIISTRRVIDFLDYPPSAIAAAVVLLATNHTPDDQNFDCFHKRVNKDMVKGCYRLIRKNMSQLLLAAQKAEHVAATGKLGMV